MDMTALRALVLDVSAGVFGVAAVVTPPGEAAFETTAIGWLPSLTEDMPVGHDRQRKEPRRVLAFRLVDEFGAIPAMPRGTLIEAAEHGGAVRTWKVDGTDSQTAEQIRVIVVPA